MLLTDLRVLDLTDHRGELGPWLLGLLGAEVIRVEPPGGSPARREHPLVQDGPQDLRSLQFRAYNDGKRSMAVDLRSEEGRRTFLDLLAGSDMVFESGPPGALAEAGISEADLLGASNRFVHVLVTPFGAHGPRATQPASELTLAALGGPMSLQGVGERAPVKISVPQVWRHTGAEAAVAAMIAYARMSRCGEAQFVDVSAQSAMTWTMLNAMEAHEVQGFDFERAGLKLQLAVDLQLGHRTKDGYSCQVPTGATCAPMVGWLIEEGIVASNWADQDWRTYDRRALSGEPMDQTYPEIAAALDELCSRYTRAELLVKGLTYGTTFAPVNRIADLLAFEHLEARSFWSEAVRLPDAPQARYPGWPVTVNGQRPPRAGSVAALDEHGAQLRASPRRQPRRLTPLEQRDGALPLEGIKVADFSWIGVGPITARCLADHGATVVRVESEQRPDGLRVQPPFKDGVFGLNRSNFYGSFNTSKLSVSLDLANPAGVAVARRLTEWADVVIDSFRPGVMQRLGLGPEHIHANNPSAIVVTTSLLGSGGPMSSMAGYGFHAGAIAGFTDLVGWPDLPPDGPWMAYTDTICPRFLATVILAALDRRARQGEGCHIEGAQLEMALHFLAPELLDHQITGRTPSRIGNRDPHLAPQGVYRCAGDDEWCAITIDSDEAWTRFVGAIGSPQWATAPSFTSLAGRLANHDTLDDHIGLWSVDRTAEAVEALLRAASVAAGKVQRSRDLRQDPQYLHRKFYHHLEHSEVGVVPYAGHQFHIRGYESGPRWAAPTLGEHTYQVLSELLGMDSEEIADAAVAGAIG